MAEYQDVLQLQRNPVFDLRILRPTATVPPPYMEPEELDNDIHEIWSRRNFRRFALAKGTPSAIYDDPKWNETHEFYDRIKPALQLASLLISRGKPILVRIAQAIISDGTGEFPFVPGTWTPTPHDYHYLAGALQELAQDSRIMYLPRAEGSEEIAILGKTMQCSDPDTPDEDDSDEEATRAHMAVAIEILDDIRADDWDEKSDSYKKTLLAILAFVLSHEVAHALWIHRRNHEVGAICAEPQILPEVNAELGDTLDNYLFGCKFHVHPLDADGKISNRLFAVPPNRTNWADSLSVCVPVLRGDETRSALFRVASRTIGAMFDKHAWEASRFPLYLIPATDPHPSQPLPAGTID